MLRGIQREKKTVGSVGFPRLEGPVAWGASPMLVAMLILLTSSTAFAQDTPDYFRQNCINCHTVGGGRLTGPDLKSVGQRREAEWLIGFMQNPKAAVDSGDGFAVKMVEESRGVVMPIAPGMTRYCAEQILKMLEVESALEKSQFEGVKISNKPFTDQDRLTGHQYFVGTRTLKNGGAACISCHGMHDISALGGGRLGPDLTRVYERLKGRKALSAWLMAPATETMQPIFKPNLNRHSDKDPQRNPVFFNEKSS